MESDGAHTDGSDRRQPGVAAAPGMAPGQRRTPYQAPLLTIAIAALVLAITIAELVVLSSRPETGSTSPVGAEAARFRVLFFEGARADDIASLLADEGLSVVRGPDPGGAYILGATDPQRVLDPTDILRRLQAHRALVRASSLAPR